MKGLKPNILALCIAGASPAVMAFTPLDEVSMSNITGQAGVTIELETQINIDRFIYTDEGALEINDIYVGGTNRNDFFSELNTNLVGEASALLDNISIEIDVLGDGDALITFLPQGALNAVDFRVRTGDWNLSGHTDSTTILSNFQADVLMGGMVIEVDTATDVLNIRADIAIDDLDVDVPFLALGFRDLRLTGDEYDPVRNRRIPKLFADLDMNIYSRENSAGVNSLAIDLQEFRADITIGGVLVGGTSIGSVMLDDLVISDTRMLVYGH